MKKIDYYIMRHAAYYDLENQYISYPGMLNLKLSVEKLKAELGEKFPRKKLRIIHSVLPRAKHTTLLICDMLGNASVIMKGDFRLNSDNHLIDEKYIKEVVLECDKQNQVCLILSHKPDIYRFCGKELKNSEYYALTIEFNDSNNENSENDDLPF